MSGFPAQEGNYYKWQQSLRLSLPPPLTQFCPLLSLELPATSWQKNLLLGAFATCPPKMTAAGPRAQSVSSHLAQKCLNTTFRNSWARSANPIRLYWAWSPGPDRIGLIPNPWTWRSVWMV